MGIKLQTRAAGRPLVVTGELRVTQALTQDEVGVELWVMRDGLNRNNWDYRNLEAHYLTFVGRPILCAYVGQKIGDGHNMRLMRDPETGALYYSFMDGTAERIVGTLSEDKKDFTLQERDGHTWIVAKGKLFTFYAPELVKKIVRTGRMDVSAETEVTESHRDGETDIYTIWRGLGVTVLGDDVNPAIPGSGIAALAEMEEEFQRVLVRAACLKPNSKPQLQNKGVSMNMNKQARERLAPKFEGYKIVALSGDGMKVGLVDKAGVPYSYTFNKEDKGEVVPVRIQPAVVTLSFAFGEEALEADIADVLEYAVNAAKTENGEVHRLQEELTRTKNEVAELRSAEHTRRIQAVKDCLNRTLEELKITEDEDMDLSEECQALAANAEQYAGLERDGAFRGAEQARADLLAACSEKRMQRAKESPAVSWALNNIKEGRADDGGIAGMLAYING